MFKESSRRQYYVGPLCCVCEDLVKDDGEQVVTFKALQNSILIRHCYRRVTVVDEEHLN